MTIYREYPCDIVVYMKFYGNPFQLCSDKWVWNKPYFDLMPYSQITVTFTTALPSVSAAAAAFSLQAPTKFKTVKKTVFTSCVKHRSGLWKGSKSCQLGGLANYSNSCKKYRPLFLDFFPILLVYFCNLTHLHTTVWYESCQSCFFLNAGCSSVL